MQLRPEQLSRHLETELAPIYVVSGEEPLQVEEALDQIRAAARARGFTERQVLDADGSFDWAQLEAERDSLSLFAEQRLLDLRLPTGKPGDAGGKALATYAEAPAGPDTMLLVSAGELDARGRRTKWYKSLEKAGVAIHAWPIDTGRLPGWIANRARARGFSISADAAAELAVRVEGNLLACAQELELLGMLCGDRTIDVETIHAIAADNARFDSFDLVEATLTGDAARCVRILRGLEREGIAPSLIAGTLAWQIRSTAQFAQAVAGGTSLEQALSRNPVWNRRKGQLARALKRHGPRFWQDALSQLREIDKMAKGAQSGDPWQTLTALCIEIAGLALFPSRSV